jgi:endonuclease YncB( thermonuclease family)
VPETYTYRATVVRVIDGDTLVADLDLGFHLTHRAHLRLANVQAPEMDTPEGAAWRNALERAVSAFPRVLVRTTGRASFERWVAEVWLPGSTLPISHGDLADLVRALGAAPATPASRLTLG